MIESESIDHHLTLVSLLQGRAKETPDRLAYSFLANGEELTSTLTYSSLDAEAKKIASRLLAIGEPGDRVLLLFQAGTSVLKAFFGALYAGMIPIPCPAPKRNKADVRFASIFTSAKPTIALLPAELASLPKKWEELNPGTASLSYQVIAESETDVTTESSPDNEPLKWTPPVIRGDSVAFLQYTSGSTSAPKGVVVSHENVLQNLAQLDSGWDHTKNSVMVTWLPYFHDMGLIYGLLMPLFRGFPCYIMSPTAFAQKPYRWLKALSDFKGTHTAAPNFAFDLCLNSVTEEQRDSLDLRNWYVALNAAETVRLKTIESFNEFFSSSGLSANTICPGFGLAEGTLKITALPKKSPLKHLNLNRQQLAAGIVSEEAVATENTVGVVGCGYPVGGTVVSIVDPESHCLVDKETIGEVWASGPAIARGYWDNPLATEKNFNSAIKNVSDKTDQVNGNSYLRTGDLGFVRDNELYITGRISELIIIHGQNYYPQDIETTVVESDVSFRPDCTAAFRVVVNDEERLVVAQEIKRTHLKSFQLEEAALKVRSALAKEHGLPLQAVLFLKPGTCPKTTSGKIQRHACRQGYIDSTLPLAGRWDDELLAEAVPGDSVTAILPDTQAASQSFPPWMSAEKLLDSIRQLVAQRLQISSNSIDINKPLAFYNLSSIHAVGLAEDLSQIVGHQLPASLLYDFATIAKLVDYLRGDGDLKTEAESHKLSSSHDPLDGYVAVIGLDCSVPGARNAEAFSNLLFSDADGISNIPLQRWDNSEYYDKRAGAAGKMNTYKGGFIEDVDLFDESFFGIAAGEAKLVDPQQRLLLEVSWNALENAGVSPASLSGSSTGVFTGISNSDYQRLVFTDKDQLNPWTGTGSALSISSNRLSYFYNLKGPSIAVDTACSSSLTAVHLACNSLRQSESQLAIVAGVNLILAPEWNIALSSAEMLSPDGTCKTFDDNANGYVRSEGCSVLILKKLSDAIKDDNSVLGVIRGSAINQDGQGNGLTAPNSQSQIDVVKAALRNAKVKPEAVSYVEAHGTGTPLGDPIEINALQQSLCQNRSVESPLLVGSVKTNVGHLEAAAGITGLVKVILAMQAGKLPAHRNFKTPNRHIDWSNLAVKVPIEHSDWPVAEQIAGVSSFGFGGTNAHVIVSSLTSVDIDSVVSPITFAEEASQKPQRADRQRMFCLSAKTEAALEQQRLAMSYWLKSNPSVDVESLGRTLTLGRDHFDWRLCITGSTVADFTAAIETTPSNFNDTGKLPQTVFIFTGQGSQYAGMGRGLYESEAVFKSVVDNGNSIYRDRFNVDLLNVIISGEELNETEFSQPAIYLIEVALAKLWISKGIKPDAVLGHSVGEYAAATISGVFSIEEGLELVSRRGQLMQGLPKTGAMVAVFSGSSDVSPLLEGHEKTLAIAAINGPSLTVLSGDSASITSITAQLEEAGIRFSRLNVSHAFHSPLMEPMINVFTDAAKQVTYRPPELTFISCLTGNSVSEEVACADYWVKHVTQPVLFEAGLSQFASYQRPVFIEIGPKPVLSSMGKQFFPKNLASWAWSLREETQAEQEFLAQSASLYRLGFNFNWLEIVGSGPMLNSLPNYPFQRRRHWISLDIAAASGGLETKPSSLNSESETKAKAPRSPKTKARCYYRPEWIAAEAISRKEPLVPEDRKARPEWYLFGDALSCKCFGAVIESASQHYKPVVFQGDIGEKIQSENANVVFFSSQSHSPEESIKDTNALRQLFQWVQGAKSQLKIWVVTSSAVTVNNDDLTEGLFQSALWGFARSAGLEIPANWAGLIDLPMSLGSKQVDLSAKVVESLGKVLLNSMENPTEDQQAIRFSGTGNLICADNGNIEVNDDQEFDHFYCRLVEADAPSVSVAGMQETPDSNWSTTGTWIITGGHGALGIQTAKWLLEKGAQKLVLCSRRRPNNETRRLIAGLSKSEGAIQSVAVDVADYSALADVMNEVTSKGALEGVVHAAGVGGADGLAALTDDSVEAVMYGKMAGGWNLHTLCSDLKPNYFICYSSIASVWSSRGQAHYAAANRYLDALCAYRHKKGLPALAVNWGPWNGGGMAEEDTLRTLANQGVYGLDPSAGLEQLACMLEQLPAAIKNPLASVEKADSRQSQVVICDIDWRILKPLAEVLGEQPFLSHLDVGQTDSKTETSEPRYAELQVLAPPQRREKLLALIFNQIALYLGVETDQLTASGDGFGSTGFVSLGMGSLSGVALKNYLENLLDTTFPATLIFDYANPEELVDFLELSVFGAPSSPTDSIVEAKASSNGSRNESVAVIGMACRFPGNISSPEQFWVQLLEGFDAITEMPDRWDVEALYCEDQSSPGKMSVKRGGFINGVEDFDAGFFSMSPREAVSLDPQQRLLMEVVWKLFEDAGVIPADLDGSSTGVFVGSTANDYREMLAEQARESGLDAYFVTGNTASAAAGRISHLFGLNGPSVALDTACSSSLAAVHMACRSIRSQESSLAIAAGVNLNLSPSGFIALSHAGALSADGRCKTFDEQANGYARSEGCGALLLKSLSDAERDGDKIYGIIEGSAMNQDGRSSGLTVPSGNAQQKVIASALQDAGVKPESVQYLEAHGTGTRLGDPIELNAIANAFHCNTEKPRAALKVGSVKANLGHMESAAGMGSLIKTILSLHHGIVPKQIHFNTPTPHFNWSALKLEVPLDNCEWKQSPNERVAAVSGFGIGGTNVHQILRGYESAVTNKPVGSSRGRGPEVSAGGYFVLPLSAHNQQSLVILVKRYIAFIDANSGLSLAVLCQAAALSRTHFKCRYGFVASSISDLRGLLCDRIKGTAENKGASPSLMSEFHKTNINSVSNNGTNGFSVEDAKSLSDAYEAGMKVDWKSLYPEHLRNSVLSVWGLPHYPFDRTRYWLKPEQQAVSSQNDVALSLKTASSNHQRFSIVENFLIGLVAEVMGVRKQEFEQEHPGFFQMGMDSIMAVEVIKGVESGLELELYPTAIFDFPTIGELTNFLLGLLPQDSTNLEKKSSDKNKDKKIEQEVTSVTEQPTEALGGDRSVNDQIDRLEELLKKI